jgi:hypothetical protein
MSLIEKIDARCGELRKKLSLCLGSRYDTERTIYTNRLDECLRIKQLAIDEQEESCKGCNHNTESKAEEVACMYCKRAYSDEYEPIPPTN